MEDYERRILSAQGYAELQMHGEAMEELNGIELAQRERPEVLEMRVLILMRMKRWNEALELSCRLCERAPGSGAGWVHAAFCLHELGRSDEAKATMLAAPRVLREQPVYHYNLACYECRLGNLEVARALLERSFAMDKKYREYARTDPDLAPLREAR